MQKINPNHLNHYNIKQVLGAIGRLCSQQGVTRITLDVQKPCFGEITYTLGRCEGDGRVLTEDELALLHHQAGHYTTIAQFQRYGSEYDHYNEEEYDLRAKSYSGVYLMGMLTHLLALSFEIINLAGQSANYLRINPVTGIASINLKASTFKLSLSGTVDDKIYGAGLDLNFLSLYGLNDPDLVMRWDVVPYTLVPTTT